MLNLRAKQNPLTPSHEAEFQQVLPDVDVKDFDEKEVEVESLQRCPGEGGQQRPVQRETQKSATPAVPILHQQLHPEAAQQEAEVEAEQRHR